MQYPAEDITPANWTISRPMFQRDWTVLIESLMRPGVIEIVDVGRHHPSQMTLIEDDHLVQALLANRSNPAFRRGITLRRQQHPVVRKSHNASK